MIATRFIKINNWTVENVTKYDVKNRFFFNNSFITYKFMEQFFLKIFNKLITFIQSINSGLTSAVKWTTIDMALILHFGKCQVNGLL